MSKYYKLFESHPMNQTFARFAVRFVCHPNKLPNINFSVIMQKQK
jgi:hypothetical protein